MFLSKGRGFFQRSACSQVTVRKNKAMKEIPGWKVMKEIPGGNASAAGAERGALLRAGADLRWESSRTRVPKLLILCPASEETAGRARLSPMRAAPTARSPRGRGLITPPKKNQLTPSKSINPPPNQLTPPINQPPRPRRSPGPAAPPGGRPCSCGPPGKGFPPRPSAFKSSLMSGLLPAEL